MRHARVSARHLLALSTAIALAAVTAVVPAPAQAAQGVMVTQSTPTYIGGHDFFEGNGEIIEVVDGGAADLYPSTIEVGEHFGTVRDANVFLDGVATTNLESLHVLLVAPDGRRALLLGHAGGANAYDDDLLLDDESAAAIPDDAAPASSDVRPSVYASPGSPPDPAGALSGDTALSTFDGALAEGVWALYVYDDDGNDVSVNGWTLDLSLVATPYPSQLVVPDVGPVVFDVDVSLHLTTTWSDDVDLLLVGPQGQHTMLMSDVGGENDLSHTAITIDDEAAAAMPDDGQITAGSYRPTNFNGGDDENDDFPAPAPAATGTSSLSVFDGTAPGGTWRLFAYDPISADLSQVDDWSLHVEYGEKVAPSGSVSIAGGAAGTRTRAVVLNLSASDPQPGSGISDVRFSNDGTTFSAFQGYAATSPWTLAAGDGTKKVYAQFRDNDGNLSPVVSDTIVLDTTGPKARKLRPKRGADDVAPGTNIKMWSTEALDPATVTKANVVLKTDGHKVKAKVTYIASRKLVKLNPKESLEPGRYVVKISTAVTDILGNRLDAKTKPGTQPLKWKFEV